jgi:hypothetical protein
MKVLAKDAKAGQWYKDRNGAAILCVGGERFVREVGDVFGLWSNEELTQLPGCTGWDWQPPKPEKKYRAFASAKEFMPHRGRWVYFCDDLTNQLLPTSFKNLGIWHAKRFTDWDQMFSQAKFADDGTPFGVEVTE